MDPITLSALIAGGSSLIGSFLQGSSNKSVAKANLQAQRETNLFNERNVLRTNENNLNIARENNAWNRENMQLQNEWNLEQWNRENAYNDPSAQVSRLLAAGINPYNAGLDGSGNAQGGLQSADVAPASDVGRQEPFMARAPQMDYTNNMFNDFLQGIMATASAASTNYDTQERRLSFEKRMEQLGAQINELESRSRLNDQQKDNLAELKEQYRLQNMFADQTFQKRVESVGLQNAVLRAQEDELKKRAALNDANTEYMLLKPQIETLDLGIKKQQVDAYIQDSLRSFSLGMSELQQRTAEMNLSESQFKREQQMQVAKMVGDWHQQARRLGIDKKQANAMSKMLEQQAKRYEWMRKESVMSFPLRMYSMGQDALGKAFDNTTGLLPLLAR